MGWMEFDGVRYFDVRNMTNYKAQPTSVKLESDSTNRLDVI